MEMTDEAILRGILERCARHSDGYPMDPSHPFVVGLIAHGLIKLRADNRAVITTNGRKVLSGFASGIDDKERRKR
jgi:hypothetical protein